MGYDSAALAGFDEWFGEILDGLSPPQRRRAAMKLGQALRRSNLKRQAANEQPDGSAMEPRKPRLHQRGRLRRKAGGKMFRRLRYAKLWAIDARPDSVEIKLRKGDRVARVHHFGLRDRVGRGFDGRRIMHEYAARQLLGFSPDDERLSLEVAAALIDPAAR